MAFALLLLSNCLFSQGLGTTTGTLAGNVNDDSGSPLPGVLISASGGEGIRTATTDAEGKYIFPFLTPGRYDVRAELQGFTTIEQNDNRVGLGQRLEISFHMKAAIHETLTVTGVSPPVDLTSTTVVANISDQLTQRIPLGRSLADIIYMAPGVVTTGIRGANFSISGASGLDNTYIVDGAVVTHPGFGGLGSVSVNQSIGIRAPLGGSGLPIEMIKEVQVITAGFEPEYGEAQGGVINVITKSGDNNFHGEGYIYSVPQNPQDLIRGGHDADAGGSIGGPILKNKLFFFGAYNLTTSMSLLFLQPDWPGYSVLRDVTNKTTTNSYSMKVSANLTSDHTVEFSASGDPSYRPVSNQDGFGLDTFVDPRMAQSEWRFGTNSQTLRWTGILSPNMFLEAQVARSHNEYVNTPGVNDLPRIVDQTAGWVDIGGFGGNIDFFGSNLQYSAKFTNLWNSHQFRYGLQFEDISFSVFRERSGAPFTAFNREVASNGYRVDIIDGADYGLDQVYRVSALLSPALNPSTTKYLNWFAQDSWSLSSNLNVTLGVRWEQQQIKGEREGAVGVTFNNNWAPRIGATYDYLKNGKSKLFFHYGRFFEKLPNGLATQFNPGVGSNSFFSDPALTQLIDGRSFLEEISEVEGHSGSNSPFRTKAQYFNEWTAGIEQELKQGFSAGAHFIFRNIGRVVENILLNRDTPCVIQSDGSCMQNPLTVEDRSKIDDNLKLHGLLTNVDGHIPGVPALVRDYKALEITVEKRFSDRWQLMGSYTYAQLVGNYEGGDFNLSSAADFALSPFTQYNYATGPLPNDIRNVVKLFSSYQWRDLNTGVAFYFQTGRPISRLTTGDFGDYLIAPRGTFGRTDSITSVDLSADYSVSLLRNQRITVGLEVFNLFNSQGVTAVIESAERYEADLQSSPLPNFLDPAGIQDARSVRLLLRYSF